MTDIDTPASPLTPNSKAHLEVIAYNQYLQAKEQIQQLEHELTEFQESSKELELELEQELAESDKRQAKLEDRISALESEVTEWRKKALDAHKEAASTQQALQREVSSLRDAHKLVKERLRETENANDDIEQRERITCSTLEDIQTRYNEALENVAILEAELAAKDVLIGEHHRAKEEIKDLTEELEHTRKKLAIRDQELEDANKRIMNPPPATNHNATTHRRAVSGTAQVSAEGYLTPLLLQGPNRCHHQDLCSSFMVFSLRCGLWSHVLHMSNRPCLNRPLQSVPNLQLLLYRELLLSRVHPVWLF